MRTYKQRTAKSRRLAKLWSERPPSIIDYKHGKRAGGISEFQRRHIRNLYERNCVLCGKSEIFNSQQLSLHHTESENSHGDGQPWLLSLLCEDCHTKIHEPTLDFHLQLLVMLKTFELAYEETCWIRRGDCDFISANNVQFQIEQLVI